MTLKSHFTRTGRWGAILIMALLLSMMAMPVLGAETGTTSSTDATTATDSAITAATNATPDTEAAADTETTADTIANTVLKVLVDGQEMDYGDAPPIVQDNRTYVGVRALALALGVPESGINWDNPSQTATLTRGTTVVKLVIGSTEMLVNEKSQTMDATPFAANNRTYLPVRYLAEAFGFTVNYDEVNDQAIITSPASPEVPEENGEVTTPATVNIKLTEADNGKTVTIAAGDAAELALESNPSTGYSWQKTQVPDAAIVSIADVQFEPGDTNLVGAPGTDRWLLTGVAAGTATLQLDYVGPGTNAIIGKTFTLTIIVE